MVGCLQAAGCAALAGILWACVPIEGGHCYADCDGDAALSIDDFVCFQTSFAVGCP